MAFSWVPDASPSRNSVFRCYLLNILLYFVVSFVSQDKIFGNKRFSFDVFTQLCVFRNIFNLLLSASEWLPLE
jgi:TctA family transporter